MTVGTHSKKHLRKEEMPRPSNWELFDKFFYPDAKRIGQSDKPKQIKGSKITHVIFDEHIEMEKHNEAQTRKTDRHKGPPGPSELRIPPRSAA